MQGIKQDGDQRYEHGNNARKKWSPGVPSESAQMAVFLKGQ